MAQGSDRFPGKAAYGKLQPDGHFVLGTFASDDGAVIGRHHVTIFGGGPEGPLGASFPKFALLRIVGQEFEVTPDGERFLNRAERRLRPKIRRTGRLVDRLRRECRGGLVILHSSLFVIFFTRSSRRISTLAAT